MAEATSTTGNVYAAGGTSQAYGLHAAVLGPVETLAQSVSAIAPSTTPSLTIPLVFALSGNATWFVYLLATGAILLVGFCVSRFARLSASPGSLYSYTADTLPPVFGVVAAWALLLAYLATGASVAGGALYYATLLAREFMHFVPLPLATLFIVCGIAGWVAWRDVKLSAEMMLWIEAISVTLIVILLALLPIHFGLHFDMDQFRLKGASMSSLGPALVLSIFSFVGFESATTLGAEARDPLRTIPRAVLQCALLTGAFFVLCAYSEVLGFHSDARHLSGSTSPLHWLAIRAGVSPLGTAVDIGAFISMFACVLACITAASRIFLLMAHGGLLPQIFKRTSKRHGTPVVAVALAAGLMFAATAAMSMQGRAGSDMYDLLGSLSVFGFLTAYGLVALALPFARRAVGQHSLVVTCVSIVTLLVMVMIVIFDLQSAADPVHARIPYIYLAYLAAGLALYFATRNKQASAL